MNAILINIKDNKIINAKMIQTTQEISGIGPDYWWSDQDGNILGRVGDCSSDYQELSVDFQNREGLGQYLRQLRYLNGWSVRKLADHCNLSSATIVNIESGKYSPRLEIVMELLSKLGNYHLCISSKAANNLK